MPISSAMIGRKAPSKNGMVSGVFHDLKLQSSECLVLFSVYHWHCDIEQPQQAIRNIFLSRCHSVRCPRHPLCHTGFEEVRPTYKKGSRYSSNLLNISPHSSFGSNKQPLLIVEVNLFWSEELLQSPSSGKPSTAGE